MFDGYYDLDKDDEDDGEELPAKTSVTSRSSKQPTGGLRKRDAALMSEVRPLLLALLFKFCLYISNSDPPL